MADMLRSGTKLPCACGCAGADGLTCLAPETVAVTPAARLDELVETAILRAVFPSTRTRRALIKTLGASTLLAAVGDVLPIDVAKSIAQTTDKRPEKTKLTVGFLPITCTVPLLLADAMDDYRKEGLDVSLVRTPSWALVRDKLNASEFDASHLVLGLPFTMSLGVGSPPVATYVGEVQNINGNAIVLALKHRNRRDPRDWKGLRFGIPHEHSMHAMLLRYYLAEHGVDPDKDVELRVYPPPDSVANMASGNLDGMLFAEPWGQRAVFEGVGFIHLLSKDIFPNHPCCTLSVNNKLLTEAPNSFAAMLRALVRSSQFANIFENRKHVAELLAPATYLNQPQIVLEQVLLGRYADGLGNIVNAPDRIGFDPFPYQSTALWLLTQLHRWKIIAADIDYKAVARNVFLSTDAARAMRDVGVEAPANALTPLKIMGRSFDPERADAYAKSFAIKRI